MGRLPGDKMIEVKNLIKKYGRTAALDNITFDINRGEIFGVIGPNGAGKSTFISILTTLCIPDWGEVLVKGRNIVKEPDYLKNIIGFVPQDIALYQMLSGMDNLNFWGGIYGLSGPLKQQRIKEVLSVVQLDHKIYNRVDTYSGGMKRRLNIAVALLHHPEILIMDEPTVGVDVFSRRLIFEAIMALKDKNKTIIFSSHNIDEMEAVCDRVAIMDKGRIAAIGSVDELKKKYKDGRIENIMFCLLKSGKDMKNEEYAENKC